jgi:hypothetical protein
MRRTLPHSTFRNSGQESRSLRSSGYLAESDATNHLGHPAASPEAQCEINAFLLAKPGLHNWPPGTRHAVFSLEHPLQTIHMPPAGIKNCGADGAILRPRRKSRHRPPINTASPFLPFGDGERLIACPALSVPCNPAGKAASAGRVGPTRRLGLYSLA